MLQRIVLAMACLACAAGGALAQTPEKPAAENPAAETPATASAIPRLPDGHPDFGGYWSSWFLTPLERPKDIKALIVSEGEARQIAAKRLSGAANADGGVGVDPDSRWSGVDNLLQINGQYRSSQITDPEDGKLPYTDEGQRIVDQSNDFFDLPTDDPEMRGQSERCMGNAGIPPIGLLPNFNMRQIIVSRGAMLLHSEEGMDTRIIRINSPHRPAGVANYLGDSIAWWEGDALTVETIGVEVEPQEAVVLPTSRVIERFILLGPDELLYRFTVDDPILYAKPWSAEFTMKRTKLRMFEYACHEDDQSLRGMLMGARIVERKPKPKPKAKGEAEAKPPATRIALEVICGPIGRCASYRLELLADGQYRYEGVRDADPMGVRDSNLGAAAFARAEAAFTAANWEKMKETVEPDKPGPCALDAPYVRITRNARGDADKTLNYNLGCDSKSAHELFDALLAVMPRPPSDH